MRPMSDTAAPLLQIENLSIAFAGQVVVQGVSLQMAAGQRLALVGESGSGKSLTALALMGLADGAAQVSGSIRFAGQELLQFSPRQWRGLRGGDIGRGRGELNVHAAKVGPARPRRRILPAR